MECSISLYTYIVSRETFAEGDGKAKETNDDGGLLQIRREQPPIDGKDFPRLIILDMKNASHINIFNVVRRFAVKQFTTEIVVIAFRDNEMASAKRGSINRFSVEQVH
jgi:hypothetical protein